MRALTRRRTKGSELLKKMGWSLYGKKSLSELNASIGQILDGLEHFVPAENSRVTLAERDTEEMKLDQKSIEVLAALSEKVDSLLHDQAACKMEDVKTFGKITLEGKATAHNGNYMAKDFQGTVPTGDGGCSFGEIHAKDVVRVRNGWQLGGEDVLARDS